MKIKIFLFYIVFSVLVGANAFSATIIVPDQQSTIQDGINAAINGDVVLVKSGIYKGTGNRDITFNGKSISVKSEHGSRNTIIDCDATSSDRHSGFIFNNNETHDSILHGFTIQNCYSLFQSGGGIYIEDSSPKIIDARIMNNSAFFHGGGIYVEGSSSPIVHGCLILNNTLTDINARGGGINLVLSSGSSPVISNTTISSNSTRNNGSALNSSNGFLLVKNSVIENNYGWGATIRVDAGQLGIENSVIRNNFSETGSIIHNGSRTNLENVLVYGNISQLFGFIISSWSGLPNALRMINTTVTDNVVESGHILGDASGGGGSISVSNSIIWNDTINQIYDPNGNVLIEYSNIKGGWLGSGNINVVPLFSSPLRSSYKLLINSPCIDAANGNVAPLFDIEGNSRVDIAVAPNTGTGTPDYVDMGAYERQ